LAAQLESLSEARKAGKLDKKTAGQMAEKSGLQLAVQKVVPRAVQMESNLVQMLAVQKAGNLGTM
jgi:hypothetical protein